MSPLLWLWQHVLGPLLWLVIFVGGPLAIILLAGCARIEPHPHLLCRVSLTPHGESVLVCAPLPGSPAKEGT